jgi:hypothetical protein
MDSSVHSDKFSPISGVVDTNSLIDIIISATDYDNIKDLVEAMRSENLAPVRNRKTGEVRISPEGRMVRRISFGPDVVEELARMLYHKVFLHTEPDVEFEMSHCDILFYSGNEEGHHAKHIDEVPNSPLKSSYVYHSMVICLDSNISSDKDGGTTVEVNGEDKFYSSNKKSNYLIFESSRPHQVLPVTNRDRGWYSVVRNKRGKLKHVPADNYVLKLKLDLWLPISDDYDEYYYDDDMYEDDCNGYCH